MNIPVCPPDPTLEPCHAAQSNLSATGLKLINKFRGGQVKKFVYRFGVGKAKGNVGNFGYLPHSLLHPASTAAPKGFWDG